MTKNNNKPDLQTLSDTIQKQVQEIQRLNGMLFSKNQDIQMLKADNEGYKQRVKELEELERIRVEKQDFKPASELTSNDGLWVKPEDGPAMFLALRRAIERKRQEVRGRIVFVTDQTDHTRVVNAIYEPAEGEAKEVDV